MSKEEFTVYVTKDALTQGIYEVKAKFDSDNPEWISYRSSESNFDEYAHGKDWHRTSEAAIDRAERMRSLQIGFLQKGLEELISRKIEVLK